MRLSDGVDVNSRFARSANIERDQGPAALRGYIPTGRAVDVIRRIGLGLNDSSAGRTFSITGPHGGGKSSLALFINALLSARTTSEHKIAMQLLTDVDQEVAATLRRGLDVVDAQGKGFSQALVTATREPVASTLERAIKELRGSRQTKKQADNPLQALTELARRKPSLIIIDEFGKNLEAFAEGAADGDPYYLQELAELTQGEAALPLIIITMQHLAFDEYVTTAGSSQRREWAKVQGRFQDIPYVDSAEQSQRLIASTVTVTSPKITKALNAWESRSRKTAESLGLSREIQMSSDVYPLHPVALAVLPALCSRFGQNERTLFSFMAGTEPLAIPAFLRDTEWNEKGTPPLIGLDRVYDYFLESAASSVGASGSVSRWLEIENKLRDSWGLTDEESAVLKTMGVLNLVSSSGPLRASKGLLEFAIAPMGTAASKKRLHEILRSLEERGLITYREFSDEYRIWQGSDFDLHGAIDLSRAEGKELRLLQLLEVTSELEPAVAGRHSQQTGILRVFERVYVDAETFNGALDIPDAWDGRVLLATEAVDLKASNVTGQKPVMILESGSVEGLKDKALEVYALDKALTRALASNVDWVALQELKERKHVAQQQLNRAVFDSWTANTVTVHIATAPDTKTGGFQKLRKSSRTLSSTLSDLCDSFYPQTPKVANEMLAKREMSSQGAKARRLLIEAMIAHEDLEYFGLSGHGPERAMYDAMFKSTEMHKKTRAGWKLTPPADPDWLAAWTTVRQKLEQTSEKRLTINEVLAPLTEPPFGLKDGILPVFAATILRHATDDVGMYEHGSLVLTLDDAVAERLARNPGNFEVAYLGATSGARKSVIDALATKLSITKASGEPTFIDVVRAVYSWMRDLPPFTQQTTHGLSNPALKVRTAFREAVEPDALFFRDLPKALGTSPFAAGDRAAKARADTFAGELMQVMEELQGRYQDLLDDVALDMGQKTGTPAKDLAELRAKLSGQGVNLLDRILDKRLKAFVGALTREHLSDDDWIQNVAMVVAEGVPPRSWTDEARARFSQNLTELGGKLRRVQALFYENISWDGEGFETRRVTITGPDGDEQSDVVALRQSEVAEMRDLLEPAVQEIAAKYGSREDALRTLMAWIAVDQVSEMPLPEITEETAGESA